MLRDARSTLSAPLSSHRDCRKDQPQERRWKQLQCRHLYAWVGIIVPLEVYWKPFDNNRIDSVNTLALPTVIPAESPGSETSVRNAKQPGLVPPQSSLQISKGYFDGSLLLFGTANELTHHRRKDHHPKDPSESNSESKTARDEKSNRKQKIPTTT